MLRGEFRNIRKIVSFRKRDGYEFLGLDGNEILQLLAIYDLRCIRQRRPGVSPLSLKNRELATAAVSRRIRGVIEGNKEPVMWVAEDNFAGKTKHGGRIQETEHVLLSSKANRLQPKIHGGCRMNT